MVVWSVIGSTVDSSENWFFNQNHSQVIYVWWIDSCQNRLPMRIRWLVFIGGFCEEQVQNWNARKLQIRGPKISEVSFLIAFIMPALFWYKVVGPTVRPWRRTCSLLLVIACSVPWQFAGWLEDERWYCWWESWWKTTWDVWMAFNHTNSKDNDTYKLMAIAPN